MATTKLCIYAVIFCCVILQVESRDEFTAQRWFYRSHSGLTQVPADIPKETVGIYINNNYITNLTKNTFSHLSTVTFMSLSDNLISHIEPGAFYGLTSLREIWFGRNQLSELRKDMFVGLESLESLVLSSNKINVTEAGCFNGLKDLINLFLYGNEFTTLKADMFLGLDSLQKMILTHNHISYIEVGTFTGLSNMIEIWIDHNNEKLSELGDDTFKGLESVEILYIHANEINTIESGLFSGLTKLRDLGLDDNRISKIKPGAFQGLDSLSRLWLYNNRLTTLDIGTFSGLPRRVELTIGSNPLQCDRNLCWIRRLEQEGLLRWIQLEDRPVKPVCGDGEGWENVTLDCSQKVECGDPGAVEHAVRSGGQWPFTVGTEFNYSCEKCWTGGGTVTCQASGNWTEKPTCQVITCTVSSTFPNGTQVTNAVTCGTEITCPSGYQVDGDAVITCSQDGKVTETQPNCRKIEPISSSTLPPNITGVHSPVTKTKDDKLELVLIVLILVLICIIIVVVVVVFCVKRRCCCCCAGPVVKGTVVYPPPLEEISTGPGAEGIPPGDTPRTSHRDSTGSDIFMDVSDRKQILTRSKSADSEL